MPDIVLGIVGLMMNDTPSVFMVCMIYSGETNSLKKKKRHYFGKTTRVETVYDFLLFKSLE